MAEKGKRKRVHRVPLTLLFFRGLIGLYLVWLAWGLRKTAFSGQEGSLPVLAAMIVFGAAGIAVTALSVIKYLRREFLLPGSEDLEFEETSDDTEAPASSVTEGPAGDAPGPDKG